VGVQLKLPEVARRLGVSEKTARRYVKSGALPSMFVGNAYRVSEEDVESFLQQSKVPAGGGSGKAPNSPLEPSLFNVVEGERRESKLPEAADLLLKFAHMLLSQWKAELPGRAEADDDEWLANVAVMWHAFGLANYAVLEEIAVAGLTDSEGWLDRYMSRYMDVNASVHGLNAAIRAHSNSDMVPEELLLETLPTTA
jgi:excisionase family DNA binding protein